MSSVYLGHHEGLGRPVAVKRLRPQLVGQEQARARLAVEAEIARSVRHDHIVDVMELVTDPAGECYLVMEHVAGEPLAARIARRAGGLPLSETLTIAVQVADAVAALHRRGILHRDLKTENVLVGLDAGGELLAKLIDFGVAEILGSPDGSIECPAVVGTPESMSPEQAQAETLDRRSDIYSFGVLLYEMVAGAPPFRGDDLHQLMQRVVGEEPLPPSQTPGAQKQLIPAPLEQLILECLAKRPDDRPPDMTDVRLRLDLIAAEYRALTMAIERAILDDDDEHDEDRPALKPALLVVDKVTRDPIQALPAVRAAGTSDDGVAPCAPGPRAPRAGVELPWRR